MSNILITGGNGGLGLAIARAFLEASSEHTVWLGVRERRTAAVNLSAAYSRCHVIELEITDGAAWTRAVAEVGELDVLVNNAGHHDDSLLATMDDESWRRVIDSNLNGTFLGCRAVVRGMMARRFGRIINVASLSALLAPLGQTNYAAAKAGVVALTQSLAKEVARAGITVNAVCPGYIETEALGSLPDERRMELARGIPMRRFGRPEEVAAAVRFLACPEASYITGSVLKIDGGIL
jgi:3-oxoacyl-[acyl-carrier protein] reductase